MAQDLSFSYAALIKADKQPDGTLKVYGKATDDAIDIDQQICDPTWLKKAMPDWFTTGGNVREQHSNIAAGVATDYEEKEDGHYITALVVDPTSVKKVEAGVLKGFSIGIRGPRVVRDNKAAGGRIVDGQIVEVSLVDRPANPNAKLMLAKAADNGQLESVKQLTIPSPADLVKYSDDQPRDENGRFGSGGGSSDSASHDTSGSGAGSSGTAWNAPSFKETAKDNLNNMNRVANQMGRLAERERNSENTEKIDEAMRAVSAAQQTIADGHTAVADRPEGPTYSVSQNAANQLATAFVNIAVAAPSAMEEAGRILQAAKDTAREHYEAEAKLIWPSGKSAEADASVEPMSEQELPVEDAPVVEAPVVEEAAPETDAPEVAEDAATEIVEAAKSLLSTLNKFDQATYDRANAAIADLIIVEATEMKAGSDEIHSIKELLRSAKHLAHWYEGEAEEGEVPGVMAEDEILMSAAADNDCGCDGGDDCACDEDKMCKCYATDKAATVSVTVDDEQVSNIISKAVETAKASVADEIAQLKTALEAESTKAIQLEAELAEAKKAAVAGGPKRAAIQKSATEINSYLAKAAEYRTKAEGTLDKTLASGYLALAEDFETKAKKGNA